MCFDTSVRDCTTKGNEDSYYPIQQVNEDLPNRSRRFDFIVQQALSLINTAEIPAFDAVDRVTTRYQYDEFEEVLSEVRARVAREEKSL